MRYLSCLLVALVMMPCSARAACTAPPAEAGVMIFNADHHVMQYCNGQVWVGMGGGGSGGVQRVSGEVVAFDLAACPEGWSEYIPARGRFIRGIDNGAGNDPAGTRAAGNTQGDAIRNIYGRVLQFTTNLSRSEAGASNGAFYETGNAYQYQSNIAGNGSHIYPLQILFDASRLVPTAPENRPKNVALLYCRKD